jgi:hypothetical protein
VPVLLGRGVRLFEHPGAQPVGWAAPEVRQSPRVTHRPARPADHHAAAPAPIQPNRGLRRRPGHSPAAQRNPTQPLDTDSKEDSFWAYCLVAGPRQANLCAVARGVGQLDLGEVRAAPSLSSPPTKPGSFSQADQPAWHRDGCREGEGLKHLIS